MKKFTKIFLIGLVVISLISSNVSLVRADSGWDGSYDSGGSTGGGGWTGGGWSTGGGHKNNWTNSNRRPTYGSQKLSTFHLVTIMTFFAVSLIILMIVYWVKNANYKSYRSPLPSTTTTDVPLNDVDRIKRILPDFDEKKFIDQAFETYKKIQEAWMDFDYETLRKWTTDELYNLYHSQLVALNLKKQKNIMKDFRFISAKIVDQEYNDKKISVSINMRIECHDYVVDKEGKVVRGTDKDWMIYSYKMTFTKGLDQKDNKCPNCNAPLENVQSSVCPYCDSTIINDKHDWILSKKQMLEQSTSKF